MNELTFDVDQASKLKAVFRRENWTDSDIRRLHESGVLGEVLQALHGFAEIKPIRRIIDSNLEAVIPASNPEWKIDEHLKGGVVILTRKDRGLYIDGKRIRLHLAKEQLGGVALFGHTFRRNELTDKTTLNANILDYLLENPKLIPVEWQTGIDGNPHSISFWGTVYFCPLSAWIVRCLRFENDRWIDTHFCLNEYLNVDFSAAVLDA